MTRAAPDRRTVWSWALYDWANSAFATVVMAGFFPLLFQDYWSAEVGAAQANLRLGWANAAGSLVIVLVGPLLGAVADRAGRKKAFLAAFAALGMVMTALLARVPGGEWLPAAVLFVCATVGFMGANVFYDALLTDIAPPERWHAVSGLGFGLGYLGGGLLYLGCALVAIQPQRFGFADASQAALAGFLATAAWWALFSLPLLALVGESRPASRPSSPLRAGWRQLRDTLSHLTRLRAVWMFLLAYWLYIDGVDTVVRMAVAYGRSLGFERQDLILALLVVQFVGFPAAIAFGRLGQVVGARRGIYLGLAVYVLIAIWGALLSATWEFYAIAVLVGLVQGGVQALSRSYFAGLIPPGRSAEFFGFYNLLGKFAAVIGPPLFGLFGAWFGLRYSMLAPIALFIAGGVLLAFVRAPDPAADAGASNAERRSKHG